MMEKSLKALAHDGRLDLLRGIIAAGSDGIAAGDLAAKNDINFTTASAQLGVLSGAGLVNTRREGRSIIYTPNDIQLGEILVFLMLDVCQNRTEIMWPIGDILSAE